MRLHQLKGYIQNIYLVEYAHGCMLLDGACRSDFELIQDFFTHELKRPLSDLKVVIVTHMHPDHAGCAHYLRSQSGCKIVSGQFHQHWYKGVSGSLSHLTDIILSNWVAGRMGKKRRFMWYPRKLYPDIQLHDGDAIPDFEDWRVITTPGHTSIDISIYNAEHRLIYVADLLVKAKQKLSPPYPVHFPAIYRESVAKLRAFSDYTVLMAHVSPQTVTEAELLSVIEQTPARGQNSKQAIINVVRKRLGLDFEAAKP